MRSLIAMHPNDLMKAYFNASLLPKRPDKIGLRRKMHGLLRRFHSVPPLNNLIIRIPFNHYKRHHIITHLRHLVRQTTLPSFIKRFIEKKMRVVFTKRDSIQDIMCNLISEVK